MNVKKAVLIPGVADSVLWPKNRIYFLDKVSNKRLYCTSITYYPGCAGNN